MTEKEQILRSRLVSVKKSLHKMCNYKCNHHFIDEINAALTMKRNLYYRINQEYQKRFKVK